MAHRAWPFCLYCKGVQLLGTLPESVKESPADSINELLGVFLVIFLYFIIKTFNSNTIR